jgi:hypothetical protein
MVTPNDRAIEIVRHLLRTALKRASNDKGFSQKQESYSRWATREILILLEKNRDKPPLTVVEEFRDKMDRYSCINLENSYKFSVAKDMAEWIIDWLIA